MDCVKINIFADFHYKQGMYSACVSDFEKIVERAKTDNAELLIHAGDFCNDYHGSPELTRLFTECSLPAYGVYGNHELETEGNTMAYVTPLITNAAENAVWGTRNGKPSCDGSVAYYFTDIRSFRFVFLDTNYSKNRTTGVFEHNLPASWGAPPENTAANSLGGNQLSWLRDVLNDAAANAKHCIVVAHASFSGVWDSSPDADKVRALFAAANAARPKTVLMSINGHYHTNRFTAVENVLYMDTNTVLNGYWQPKPEKHYFDECFLMTEYDESGAKTGEKSCKLSELTQGGNTYFFKEPLSAAVTVFENGDIEIKGSKTEWFGGIAPATDKAEIAPEISNYSFKAD